MDFDQRGRNGRGRCRRPRLHSCGHESRRSRKIDRVVGLDEFDVLTAAMTREHLQHAGMSRLVRSAISRQARRCDGSRPRPGFHVRSSSGLSIRTRSSVSRYASAAPWIVKPRHEVSAFGIRKCETKDEVWTVLTDLDNAQHVAGSSVAVPDREVYRGTVFHVDSVVSGGKVVACGVSQYGTTPFKVSHHGGVFTSSTVPYHSKERKELEMLNKALADGV